MPEQALDLWPDISASKPRTPLSIMKQQAALLGKHTNNLLEGEVETKPWGVDLVHRFIIVAPTLSYRYELFKVTHGVAVYPVVVSHPGSLSPDESIQDEETFVNWLKNALNSDFAKHILGGLLAQAES
jgi:hypothetical protein